jgi:hypothetical protein
MSGLLIFASGGNPIPRAPTRTSLWQLVTNARDSATGLGGFRRCAEALTSHFRLRQGVDLRCQSDLRRVA